MKRMDPAAAWKGIPEALEGPLKRATREADPGREGLHFRGYCGGRCGERGRDEQRAQHSSPRKSTRKCQPLFASVVQYPFGQARPAPIIGKRATPAPIGESVGMVGMCPGRREDPEQCIAPGARYKAIKAGARRKARAERSHATHTRASLEGRVQRFNHAGCPQSKGRPQGACTLVARL